MGGRSFRAVASRVGPWDDSPRFRRNGHPLEPRLGLAGALENRSLARAAAAALADIDRCFRHVPLSGVEQPLVFGSPAARIPTDDAVAG